MQSNNKEMFYVSAFPYYTAICKAMKSIPLLEPLCGSEFLGFSLLKI